MQLLVADIKKKKTKKRSKEENRECGHGSCWENGLRQLLNSPRKPPRFHDLCHVCYFLFGAERAQSSRLQIELYSHLPPIYGDQLHHNAKDFIPTLGICLWFLKPYLKIRSTTAKLLVDWWGLAHGAVGAVDSCPGVVIKVNAKAAMTRGHGNRRKK